MEDKNFLVNEKGEISYGVIDSVPYGEDCESWYVKYQAQYWRGSAINYVSNRNEEKDKGDVGYIKEDLLQHDLIIDYETEEEKEEILKRAPEEFFVSEEGKKIIIKFQKTEVKAPLYANQVVKRYYMAGTIIEHGCVKTEEEKTLSVTLKTHELTQKILDFKSQIYSIKLKFHPESYYDMYDASKSTKHYLRWLAQKGEIDISDSAINVLKHDPDRWAMRFNYKGKHYVIEFGDTDSWSYSGHYNGFEEYFEQYVEQLKENGEYYIPNTEIPKYEVSRGKKELIRAKTNSDEEYLLVDRNGVYGEYKAKGVIGAKFPFGIGKVILTEDNRIICDDGTEYKMDTSLYKDNDDYSFEGLERTKLIFAYNDSQVVLVEAGGSIKEFEREEASTACEFICTGDTVGFIDGNTIRLIDSSKDIKTFEIEEGIRSIETQNGYLIINDSILCCGLRKKVDIFSENVVPSCKKINNLHQFRKYMQTKKIYIGDFIENENGCFSIAGFTEQEKVECYREHGFKELYEALNKEITEREKQQKEEEQRKNKNDVNLYKYVNSAQSLLVPVVFSNPRSHFYEDGPTDRMHNAKIFDANTRKSTELYYYEDNPSLQSLYGEQEKGWTGTAYRGMLINVELAKRLTRAGKLHLNVPEEVMGKIIGKGGSNINLVTERLKGKRVPVNKIILHPKTRDEMNVNYAQIAEAIKRAQERDN